MESKAWAWEKVNTNFWKEPSSEYYYIAHTWAKRGFKNVLDLGCGLGRHALAFRNDGFNVSACDLSEYAINYARNAAKECKINDIQFDVCDMLTLPYRDNSFDAVFAYHVISHTDSVGIQKIADELKRILKPSGELYIDFISKEAPQFINATNRIDDNTIIMEEIEEEYGIPHYFAEITDIMRIMKDFEIVDLSKRAKYNFKKKEYNGVYYFVHARKGV